jgi:hypothetical protein
MSVLLYVLGLLSVAGGAAAILFGIPVKEFSFGDTLIVSGTVGLMGGLIVIGLGAAVSHLHRIGEMLGARPLSRAGRPLEPFGAPGRIPFPPKPKSETKAEPREHPAEMPPMPLATATDSEPGFGIPPSLRNPDVPLMREEEAAPLSPRNGNGAPPRQESEADLDEPEQTSFESAWRSPPPPRPTPAKEPPARAESIPRAPKESDDEPTMEPPSEEAAPVAVLKSGVVDGMGYTLYVDGSIEAELPDGTLRFASINELRTHLEKNS